MATFQKAHNIDKRYVECPYNRNHRIPANRLPIHLVKCCKQSEVVLLVCPFNAAHRLHRRDFPDHINRCKDQTSALTHIPKNTTDSTNPSNPSPVDEDQECWD